MACKLIKLPRSSYNYIPVVKHDERYIAQLNELVQKHISVFKSIQEIRNITEEWIYDYNYNRPHKSLENKTPMEYRLA
jgi:transposase InsO family protein